MDRTVCLIYCLIVTSLVLSVDSTSSPFHYRSTSVSVSSDYKRLARYCYIDNYSIWLERQRELFIWLDLVKLLGLPIDGNELIKKELERYRLQHECLRAMERLPVGVGPGK